MPSNEEPKGRWLGGDPANGYASVAQMPGAPGINDAAINAEQGPRHRMLNPQQFGMEGPQAKTWEWPENRPENKWMPKGWKGKPPTAEELGY